ncbi:methyl-accepting chemotaxis protein [Shewanella algae]|uniref:methyl-accepting chemotaxis protein n=1 Tax=Shewanella algae TaxID=38313 RepID=UPI001AACC7A0|nr:methyl-accepting chemotaxis protein [Shewanella algae]MBO2569542.1 methyl-accepting chemotaxis protein [Shewanella algae]MBO2586722.1 methyl-accepting chemotaxis protein [Shewanella algae]
MKWQWIENLPLKHKFLLVILPPFIAATLFGILLFSDRLSLANGLEEVLDLSELAVVNSALVHELQKERGMSAGYLGSKGKSFADKLPGQRQLTDNQLQQFNDFLNNHQLPTDFAADLTEARNSIARLREIRSQVDRQGISVAEEVAFYTQLNKLLLSIVDLSVQKGGDQQIAMQAAAFSAFLQMKERAGIERAVLSSTFGQSEFKPGVYRKFITLVSEQDAYQERFVALADETALKNLQVLQAQAAVAEVARLRELAFGQKAEDLKSQSPETWFTQSTARIDLLHKFEQQLSDKLLAETLSKQQSAANQTWLLLGIMVIGLIIVSLVSSIILKYLHGSLRELHQGVTRARAHYDLSVRLPHTGKDEFGELAESFNSMMTDFEQVILRVRSSSKTLLGVVQQMEQHSTQMQADVSVGYSETEQVASAMTEMSSTVQEIASNAVRASEASNQASTEAREGSLEVGRTASAINELAEEISYAADAISKLDKDIHGIVSVLEVISGIAEQTNLLALNAAIEAARAGEMGRGFAVVADEVRNLAQRAQSSTEDIRNMTVRLKQGAEVAVAAITKGKTQAGTSVDEANRAGEELRRIVEHVEVIDSMNEQIAAATHEQSAVSEEVNRNAMKISDIYRNTQDIANELGKLNELLIKDANKMSDEVSKFRLNEH